MMSTEGNSQNSLLKFCRQALSLIPMVITNLNSEGAKAYCDNYVNLLMFATMVLWPWTRLKLIAGFVAMNLFYGLATLISADPSPDFIYVALFVVIVPIVTISSTIGILESCQEYSKKRVAYATCLVIAVQAILALSSSSLPSIGFRPAFAFVVLSSLYESLTHRGRFTSMLKGILLACAVFAALLHSVTGFQELGSSSYLPPEQLFISMVAPLFYSIYAFDILLYGVA